MPPKSTARFYVCAEATVSACELCTGSHPTPNCKLHMVIASPNAFVDVPLPEDENYSYFGQLANARLELLTA